MRKLTIGLTFFAATFLSAPADASLSVGDRISFTNQVGSTRGGEFGVHRKEHANPFDGNDDLPEGELFRTFCLEQNEFIDFDQRGFIITSIGNAAVNGGKGGGNPDEIEAATAWLFYNFTIGTLDSLVSGYSYGDTASANALQNAIWYLEEEIDTLPTGLVKDLIDIASAADATVALARTVVLNIVWSTDRHGFQGLYDNVMGPLQTNATPAQSVLYVTPENFVVPEASTIAVWSVLSVIGLAATYRKRAQ